MTGVSRKELRALSESRIDDAQLLLDAQRYSSAYYLAGLSVELALKAVIAQQFDRHSIPDPRLMRETYQHNLGNLFRVAQIWQPFETELSTDLTLKFNWAIVSEWSVDSRYEIVRASKAREMVEAASVSPSGVLEWIKRHW